MSAQTLSDADCCFDDAYEALLDAVQPLSDEADRLLLRLRGTLPAEVERLLEKLVEVMP